jgi:murein DD-endopeptidase MepM/ murein hydrolase activator NlpD
MPGNGLPEGLDVELAERWFGDRFNPNGAVSQRWLKLGRFPRFEGAKTLPTGRFDRFADGTVFRRVTAGAEPIIVACDGERFPEGVDQELLADWFGETENDGRRFRFEPDDAVCRLWLRLGRFPRLEWTDDFDSRTYFRFADGTVIWRPSEASPYRLMGVSVPVSIYPEGMDRDLAERWFGERFNARGGVSRLWLKRGLTTKRYPRFEEEIPRLDGRFYRFADGTVFRRTGAGSAPVLFPNRRGTIADVMGGVHFEISQPYGPTDFVPDPPTAYDYCRDYGCPQDVRTHCGVDISVVAGTDLFAPADGRVICAGTGVGLEACAAFRDSGGGAGRVELEIEGGVRLIYGHASRCFVAPGDEVAAGERIAISGGAGTGDHLHLEVRVPDDAMPARYRTVDPLLFFAE